jgi:hypothetical protein
MRSTLAVTIAVAGLTVASVCADEAEDRLKATFEYSELLEEQPRMPVDPFLALEGLSEDPFLDDLTPGYVVIEGCIQVPYEEYLIAQEEGTKAVYGNATFWGSTIPFDFAGNVNATRQQQAIDAMNAISARVGINFVARTNQTDWIRFQASSFNNSPIGRRGGMQIINITSWNTQIIIIHEIYHSLGFWHEQSASDRDTFVTINWNNICGSSNTPGNQCHAATCQGCVNSQGNFISCAFNFDIEAAASVWGPYDFDSFMHYPRWAFSCNGNDTITVNAAWNAQWQNQIGQRDHFSLIDELSCRGIYPFAGDRWLRTGTSTFQFGTFFFPYRASFSTAFSGTPANGTLLIDPGTYSGVGLYSQAKFVRGTFGTVLIGN